MFKVSLYDDRKIWVLTLDNPPANALGSDQIQQLDSIIGEAGADPDLRAVIFRSTSRFFSAGADIALISASLADPEGAEHMAVFCRQLQGAFARIEALDVPSFAAISGICVGGGFELAMACDFRIAGRNARLGLPEVKIGLLPGAGGTQRLVALAGRAVATRLIMSGDLITGAQACQLNLVTEYVAEDDVFERTLDLARGIVDAPRASLSAIKRCISLAPSAQGYEAEIAETRNLHRESGTRARVTAFLENARNRSRERT